MEHKKLRRRLRFLVGYEELGGHCSVLKTSKKAEQTIV